MEMNAGFTNSSYGENTRYLNEAINRLRELGSEAILGEMPKIAVIGNQSAGKSSLIEAMSGVNFPFVEVQFMEQIRVPRQVGTCTRCPMEVVLSHVDVDDAPWRCQITLRLTHDRNGLHLGEPETIPFGDVMTDSNVVEDRLKRAQAAILELPFSNDQSVEPFLASDYQPPAKPRLDFSRNVVRLDVHGPDLVDVTFIDLPGVISNAPEQSVDTVTRMVSEYIGQNDCLILVAISMAGMNLNFDALIPDDIENQGAARLARHFDRAGKRTIGVLTKADMVTNHDVFQRWLGIINGLDLEHHLTHGYYITMQQRSSMDATWQDNHKQETDFFKLDPLWSNSGLHSKIGCLELRKKLSIELSWLIKERIPDLMSKIRACKADIQSQINALPRTVEDVPHVYLSKLCNTFAQEIALAVKGIDEGKGLAWTIDQADTRLKMSVLSSIARFGLAGYDEKKCGQVTKIANDFLVQKPTPLKRQTTRPTHVTPPPAFPPDSDDDVIEFTPTQTVTAALQNRARRFNSSPQHQRARVQRETPPEDPEAIQFTGSSHFSLQLTRGEEIELEELRKMIHREKARRLPGAVSAELHDRLISKAMSRWEQCAKDYLTEVVGEVDAAILKLCKEIFGRFQNTKLYGVVAVVVSQILQDLARQASAAIDQQWQMESRPFTLNHEHHTLLTNNLEKEIVAYRSSESPNSKNDYKTEIRSICTILAYLKIAYNRFIDVIPMRVEYSFQTKLSERIRDSLMATLISGEGFEERCRAYLEDDHQIVEKRVELNRNLEIVRLAERELNAIQNL